MGVNDLVEEWKEEAESTNTREGFLGFLYCASDLYQISRECWNPPSQPPTEEDGDWSGYVVITRAKQPPHIDTVHWTEIGKEYRKWAEDFMWARVEDVVLLPTADPSSDS